ncbi:MAG: ATP-dependent Clp protease proteolytic subunit [Lutisporaceae bacterium]
MDIYNDYLRMEHPEEQPQNPQAPNAEVVKQTEAIKELGIGKVPQTKSNIHCIPIIGQIEGHVLLPPQSKATKYEHIIPQILAVEESPEIDGLLLILNTVGGDVEAGLAISELVSSMKKPSVSLVLGGGHSIGVPLAVCARYSFIAPSATMTIHPIRMNGLIIGVPQTFEYFNKMQERIINFIVEHSKINSAILKKLMFTTSELANDIGSVIVGSEAVDYGLINKIGGLKEAMAKLRDLIEKYKTEEK